MPTALRTWNLFHGNTTPPGRRAYLREMVELSVEGADVVCLQELPVWALRRLEEWSGRRAFPVVAERPSLGPLPGSAELGRVLTELHHGLLRSAFTGQGNAILVAPGLRTREHESLPLNPRGFRRAQSRWLGLPLVARLAWAKERRVVQALRVETETGKTLLVANLHATAYRPDRRLAEAELVRAAAFVDGLARPGEPVVLAGDLNVRPDSPTFLELVGPEWGFHGGSPGGIDHVLVRGIGASPPRRWPAERRRRDGRLLSDHAPVEVTLA